MPSPGELGPELATILLLTLNGIVPLPRAVVCIPAGAALGWAAIGPTLLGTAIGFALGFGIARFALREIVARRIDRHPRLSAVMRAVDEEGWRLLALLRLGSPVPGPLINLACGVTRMGFGPFLVTGLLAVVPQTLLYIYLGHAGRQALASSSLFSLDTLMAPVGLALTLVALWRIALVTKRQTARMMAKASSA